MNSSVTQNVKQHNDYVDFQAIFFKLSHPKNFLDAIRL